MYKSTKKEDGTYSRFAFLKRGYELVSLPYFLSKLNKYIRLIITYLDIYVKFNFISL